jgi:hypothetical protein
MLAWHYTTGQNFQMIVESGELLPTASFIAKGEKPILWFSQDQDWEPTACKGWIDPATGTRRTLTRWETFEKAGGLVRFGLPTARLIAWPEIARLARMPKKQADALVAVGLKQGAIPMRWMGTLDSIGRDEWYAIDVWDSAGNAEAGRWVRVDSADTKGR